MGFFFFNGMVLLSAQHQLIIEVKKVPDSEGKISAALYTDAKSFLKFDKVFAATTSDAVEGRTQLVLNDIPSGNYAVALFHDKNGNDELDTNWMGIPKEKVAFSNAKMKLFGPPSFEECSFELKSNQTLEIRF